MSQLEASKLIIGTGDSYLIQMVNVMLQRAMVQAFLVAIFLSLITVRTSWAQIKSGLDAFHLDANGWPTIPSSIDSRTIYVSSSTGKDSNLGRTIEMPVATIAAGLARLRNGYPDRLLLKAGDVFVNQSFGNLKVSGRSVSAPMVFGSYGTGPAPVVETNPEINYGIAIGSLPKQGGNFVIIEGIDFYSYTRDPHNAAYAGPKTSDLGTFFLNPNTWVMLVANKFRYYTTGVIFNSGSGNATSSDVTLYRNIVVDSWSATSHSQGLYVSGVGNLLIEQNLFDHNGWNESIPGSEATIFNRNVYLQSNNGTVTFVGNISANSSSEGIQARSGGTISGNLFLANSAGIYVGENPGTSEAPVSTLTSAVVSGNVILNSTSIRSSSGPLPRGQGIHVFNASGAGVEVTGNIIADPTGPPVNQSGVFLNSNVVRTSATNNIIYGVAHPIDDTGTGNTTSPNAINLIGYNNPGVSIGSYNASLGGTESLSAFLTEARKQSKGNWRPEYTAKAAIDYIHAGFSVGLNPTLVYPH
jgi:hypothetical protein